MPQGLTKHPNKKIPQRSEQMNPQHSQEPQQLHTTEYLSVKREVLRDIHASGGLPQGRVSLEVLYLLPDAFVDAYVKLFWEALAEVGGGGVEASERNLIAKGVSAKKRGSGGKDGHGSLQSRGGGKKYKNTWLLRNEKALRAKAGIDNILIQLAQEMTRALEDEKRVTNRVKESLTKTQAKRCPGSGCGRFNAAKSNFCSNCGTKL